MKALTHNGFILAYNGYTFPPSGSNRITKGCFLFMGSLANERLMRVTHSNGSQAYETYHRIDKY